MFGRPSDGRARTVKALRDVYADRGKTAEFASEEHVLSDLVAALAERLAKANYELLEPKAIGSTAIVWRVRDKNLGVDRALKLPRPRLGKLSEVIRITRIIREERWKLAALNHPNLVRVYFGDDVTVKVGQDSYGFPFFVMDWLEDIEDLDKYILKHRRSLGAEEIISYFKDVLTGLLYLHQQRIVHCDIKPANLLIAKDRPALISDLGYSKTVPRIAVQDPSLTTVTFTERYAHPKLIRHMINKSDPSAATAEISPDMLEASFDLYAFGRTIEEVLKKLRDAEGADRELKTRSDSRSGLSEYQWQYLELIARRLLDGQVSESTLSQDTIPRLPPSVMEELKYRTALEGLEDIEKLLHLYDLEGDVPELNPQCATYTQIPLQKVALTPRVARILNHPAVARLGQLTQLGFVSLVYPGATHSRLEHVSGTFASCCNYVRALWYDEHSCLFRSIMRRSDLELALVASLLHDVSQYPMAHDLTETSSRFAHERYLEAVLLGSYPGAQATLGQLLRFDWNLGDYVSEREAMEAGLPSDADPRGHVRAVLEVVSPARTHTLRTRILNSILSGPLDCDKLDYLRRDSVHLGVGYGLAVDEERLLRNLTVVYDSKTEMEQTALGQPAPVPRISRAEIGVFEKALAAAQGVWGARQDMFRQVYWQHTVRSFKAMLAFAVRRVLLRIEERGEKDGFWADFNDWLFDWRLGMDFPVQGGTTPVELAGTALEAELGAVSSTAKAFTSLSPSDDSVLDFFGRWSDQQGTAILSRIRMREPYRRVAVMSQQISGPRYDNLYHQFAALRLREDHEEIEKLRRAWQEALITQLECQLDSKGVDVLPGGLPPIKAVAEMRRLEPLVLVDIPVKATSAEPQDESFLYVPEDVSGVHSRSTPFPEVKEAAVKLAQESFDREVGKIRVFVAPEWAETMARFLSDREILDAILHA